MARTVRLRVPEPFSLPLVLTGHGWYGLAPFEWDAAKRVFSTPLELRSGKVVDTALWQTKTGLSIKVDADPELERRDLDEVKDSYRRMLRLDLDLEPFWSLCRETPRLAWVCERGGGRLLRAPTLFEDLMKLVFTTNCNWSATKNMTNKLVAALGRPAPSGRRSFPAPERCAEQPEDFWREVVRCGYRASSCHKLATGFAEGTLRETDFSDPELDTDEVRVRLLALPGIGPYAAGQALRLLGRHDDLALDSWCRATIARLDGRKKPPSDRTIERRYKQFGEHAGLALWMDLTADWHA